ncbi:MAG: aminotransferase class I/II-fold pyridoxal phosphate-dependent enzyme [Bacteroidota bacterium]
MRNWKKLKKEAIRETVINCLLQNTDFRDETIIGVPGSYLDEKVFNHQASFLQDAPFLTALLNNPNHIGCHTLGHSEPFFKGSHELERTVIRICAEDIMNGAPNGQDGYIASGGTEANIQALWIFRNYFMQNKAAEIHNIAILCSTDTHYSIDKAANILNIHLIKINIEKDTRKVCKDDLDSKLKSARENGIRQIIVVANMMTTMFGSVDNLDTYLDALSRNNLPYKVHVDAAYGGFFHPFSTNDKQLTFANPAVDSITMDAHKKLQAPYGTGIFLARKGMMEYAVTPEAQYVKGLDSTLSGSRSGANAISVWMILTSYGPHGWFERINTLVNRTEWLCTKLTTLGIRYFRETNSNIVTIWAEDIPEKSANTFGLVPNKHSGKPEWYKIVVMDHVSPETIEKFLETLPELATV